MLVIGAGFSLLGVRSDVSGAVIGLVVAAPIFGLGMWWGQGRATVQRAIAAHRAPETTERTSGFARCFGAFALVAAAWAALQFVFGDPGLVGGIGVGMGCYSLTIAAHIASWERQHARRVLQEDRWVLWRKDDRSSAAGAYFVEPR